MLYIEVFGLERCSPIITCLFERKEKILKFELKKKLNFIFKGQFFSSNKLKKMYSYLCWCKFVFCISFYNVEVFCVLFRKVDQVTRGLNMPS